MVPDDAATARPDDRFAILCGLYLAAIGGTLVMLLTRFLVAAPGLVYGSLLVVAATVTVVGTLLARRRVGLAGSLGRTRLAWWLAVGPIALGLGPFGLQTTGLLAVSTSVVATAAFGGIAAGILGLIVASMATTRWVVSETADATVRATWRAPWPERDRRLALVLGVVLVGLGVIGLGVGIWVEHWLLQAAGQMAIPFGALLSQAGRPRKYRATDRGLEIQHPTARRLVRWSSIRTSRVTADAIVLQGGWWLSPGWRFDRTAIEGEDAVLSALDRYVDRG